MTKPKKVAAEPVDQSDQALEELKSDLQRVQADFVNFRRRIEGERGELMEVAKAAVVEELLPLFDNLDRALAHTPAELADNAWVLGVEQVAKQVTEALANLDVQPYGETGDEFDPNLHEAVAHEGEGSHITEVLSKGYRNNQRIIRPAMVKVGTVKKEGEK